MNSSLSFQHILTPEGFERHKRLSIDEAGVITEIVDDPGPTFDGWLALPGMPNAHSHSFQRALTGLGERAAGGDSFWSWREAMYGIANRITPDDLAAISARAFADMVRAGFCSVAEFHYLHHHAGGGRADMARAVVEGASRAGIRLVLLPVLYQAGGFNEPPTARQSRFVHENLDDYLRLLEELGDIPLGIAPHSIRAVPPARLASLDEAARGLLGDGFPRHIHISEQRLEVRQCMEAFGRTPIQVLADHVALDEHWNLVHATHATDQDQSLMLRSGVTVVLCPITEAYLGDGVFPATEFIGAGGRSAIGSDSNIRIDAIEELRMLEYGQRLATQSRACLATGEGLGRPLWLRMGAGGGRALALDVGAIAPGRFADIVALDPESPVLGGLEEDAALDALVTAGSAADIRSVYVGGREIATRGRHAEEDSIQRDYADVMDRLRRGL